MTWAKNDTTANMLILGAIQSPLVRSFGPDRAQSVCPRCNVVNPPWEHLWECFVGEIPDDTFLRRYCWPVKKQDMALCTAFLEGMKSFHDSWRRMVVYAPGAGQLSKIVCQSFCNMRSFFAICVCMIGSIWLVNALVNHFASVCLYHCHPH